jgi:hypothetical protein
MLASTLERLQRLPWLASPTVAALGAEKTPGSFLPDAVKAALSGK